MLNFQKSFLDIYVRRAIFSHCTEFYDMALGRMSKHAPDNVECHVQIVIQRQLRRGCISHRVRGRRLLCIMDRDVGLEMAEEFLDDGEIAQIRNDWLNAPACTVFKLTGAFGQGWS